MKSIAVFCGSSDGYSDLYKEVAYEVGAELATRGIKLIYGGAKVGLMGALADGALQINGQVIGVIPSFLQTKEVAHENLTECIITRTMHERKMKMHELSDAIIALPGGWGTMEELFEMMTWAQLGLHQKPIGLLNINGFYEPLLALLDTMVMEGFSKESYRSMIMVGYELNELLVQMQRYEPPELPKWITEKTT
ncbi:MAG: TIGR00730 family Rossman fold protein [Bacteroidetes bacterium]|nr:TIGR00730 family Rossman fold protein [Bacteroidota bacterium]